MTWSILVLGVMISLGGYLLASAITFRIGFPLDDSWIHQTFARNLAQYGEWAFIPGEISGGSTAPLWSVLLSLGYKIHLSPYIWTFFLGGLLLLGLAAETEIAIRRLVENYRGYLPWAGLLVIFEWHLVWASASGMETLLHALIILIILISLFEESPHWAVLGLLTGVSVWVRPDGLTLLGPILMTAFFNGSNWKARSRSFLSILIGFGTLFIPYILFNLILSRTVMPTTFYAKQAEYIAWQSQPILSRVGEILLQFLTGSAIILLPGVVLASWDAIRKKDWGRISILLWILGYIGIYLFRLPAYQHGRYIMPAMPIYFVLGLEGFLKFILSPKKKLHDHRLLKSAWVMTILMVCAGSWFLGMRSYCEDVRYIESEMVTTAKWVAKNVPPGALVAAHDIGAMGYFGNHNLVDLAGLINPEVIPFITDEKRIAAYLDERRVDYLVTFPSWYPSLTRGLHLVFTTGAPYAPSQGGENMAVYLWPGQ